MVKTVGAVSEKHEIIYREMWYWIKAFKRTNKKIPSYSEFIKELKEVLINNDIDIIKGVNNIKSNHFSPKGCNFKKYFILIGQDKNKFYKNCLVDTAKRDIDVGEEYK